MAVSIIKAKGTLLKYAAVGGSLAVIAQVISVDSPTRALRGYEAIYLDQSGNGVGRELDGFVDGGSFKASLYFDPSSHAALWGINDKTLWGIFFVGGTNLGFTSAEFKISVKVDASKGLMADIEGNVDGDVTFSD